MRLWLIQNLQIYLDETQLHRFTSVLDGKRHKGDINDMPRMNSNQPVTWTPYIRASRYVDTSTIRLKSAPCVTTGVSESQTTHYIKRSDI